MFFLILNVFIHGVNLRMGIGESAISFLPAELERGKFFFSDKLGGSGFYVSYQIG